MSRVTNSSSAANSSKEYEKPSTIRERWSVVLFVRCRQSEYKTPERSAEVFPVMTALQESPWMTPQTTSADSTLTSCC